MDKEYVYDILCEILALILCEDIKGAKRVCRREIEKIEEER